MTNIDYISWLERQIMLLDNALQAEGDERIPPVTIDGIHAAYAANYNIVDIPYEEPVHDTN